MSKLPLDANDEDIQLKGLVRPNIGFDPLAVQEKFQAVRTAYDNATSGGITTDNIFPTRSAEELSRLDPAQRFEYLSQRGLIPPVGSIPSEVKLPGVDALVKTAGQASGETINKILESSASYTDQINSVQDRIKAVANGSLPNLPTDSYGQALVGQTTQPQTLTNTSPTGPTIGTQPATTSQSNVYRYEPLELYDDRYDFLTGKIIRKGIATGSKGGIGQDPRSGNTVPATGSSSNQQEASIPPANLKQTETSTEQYDDAILRQARQDDTVTDPDANDPRSGQYSSPTVNNATTAEIGRQPDQTVDTTAGADSYDTSSWKPPASAVRKTETTPPRQTQAPRDQIRKTRKQSSIDIKVARAKGVKLERRRNSDGTYYTAPATGAKDVTNNKNLPQRYRDF